MGIELKLIWKSIKYRVRGTNPKTAYYNHIVGERICKEWASSFEIFENWALKNGWSKGLIIDRVDNYKGYSPSNCRIVDYSTSNANRLLVTKKSGVQRIRNKYYPRIVIHGKTVSLGGYVSLKEAIKVRNKYIKDNNLPHLIQSAY